MTLINIQAWALIVFAVVVPLLLALQLLVLVNIGGNLIRLNKMLKKTPVSAVITPAAAPVPTQKVEPKEVKAVVKK